MSFTQGIPRMRRIVARVVLSVFYGCISMIRSESSAALIQSPECFTNPTWSLSQVVKRSGLVYGSAWNNLTRREQTLSLDLYTPPASDQRRQRPAMVLVHGGAFCGGSSVSDGEPDLARALVSRGFVVASINYRLTGSYWGTAKYFPDSHGRCCPGTQSDQYAIDASHDAKAAIRFLRKTSNQTKIDPDRIGLAGDSAGAFTTLFSAYVSKVGEGSSGNPGYPSSISCAVSISGELALYHMCRYIQGANTTHPKVSGCVKGSWNHTNEIGSTAGQPPLSMVHGTADMTVPYEQAVAMQARANMTGLQNQLITILGGGHVPMQQLIQDHMGDLIGFIVKAMNLKDDECPIHNQLLNR